MDHYSSKLLNKAVEQFSLLPGVGKRTALRLVLHLLKQEKIQVSDFAQAIIELRQNINYCTICFNISDQPICDICNNVKRQAGIICIVEDIRDVLAIENTGQFTGLYHVLGGVISPMDGIGPSDLTIDALLQRIAAGNIKEVIMALGSTMEGDTTNFYLYKRIKDYDLNVSTIARGMAIGDQIEYTDEITLGKSILNRIPYEQSLRI